ncbi:MAG: S8 family serine peptidase [Rubellimicrobium sp.]|nr:S8 family serine peptidase [Rubellimicrobium sp.]
MTPTDPLYRLQWHFNLIGDIETIWEEFSGAGVRVGVYDDGVDYLHEDLAGNYDASLHITDRDGQVIDPRPLGRNDAHGTACAGLIAAEANGIGGVGVAHGATITGVNIFGRGVFGNVNRNQDDFMFVAAQADRFDISSNSWGATPIFADGLGEDSFAAALHAEYATLSASGRDGLGTIVVQAAGNDNLDANGSGVNSSRHTITVASTDEAGDATWYSNFGACILVAAPAGAVTTDLTGPPGYSPGDYTFDFGGTSAATPIVSGVIALMLEANGTLGWRDVHNILAASASLTGSDFDARRPGSEEDGTWQSNGAGTWNGGGYHIHTNYGYGMVDVFAAVRMAEVWSLFYDAQTSSNEAHVTATRRTGEVDLFAMGPEGFTTTFRVTDDMMVEHVALSLDFTGRPQHLVITLTSPDGTVINVAENAGRDPFARGTYDGTWVFGIEHLRGESAAGIWTLNVVDTREAGNETLRGATLDIYGSELSEDKVHHFTDEYLTMIGHEGSRRTIEASADGTDWLNMAAVTGNIVIDLSDGATFRIGGRNAGTLNGDFEHIVAGDGNDTIRGNDLDNQIHGGRGNDTLFGGGGTNTLFGGQGDDTYHWNGRDRLVEHEGEGIDTVISPFDKTLPVNIENLILTGDAGLGRGNIHDNVLTGNDQDNVLFAGPGNDILFGGGGTNTLSGGKGDDTYFWNGRDTLVERPGEGVDTIVSGIDTTLPEHFERLDLRGDAVTGIGNSADNEILGTLGANTLMGLDGNDTLKGGGGPDQLWGGSGDDILIGGAGNDTLYGGNGRDQLFGGPGNDMLFGGLGQSTLTGGAGQDVFVFDTPLAGRNFDIITDFTPGEDRIWLDDAVFRSLSAGDLDASAFASNTTGLATDSQHRIIYNSATGELFLDRDGIGGQQRMKFAEVTPGLDLSAADFFVF